MITLLSLSWWSSSLLSLALTHADAVGEEAHERAGRAAPAAHATISAVDGRATGQIRAEGVMRVFNRVNRSHSLVERGEGGVHISRVEVVRNHARWWMKELVLLENRASVGKDRGLVDVVFLVGSAGGELDVFEGVEEGRVLVAVELAVVEDRSVSREAAKYAIRTDRDSPVEILLQRAEDDRRRTVDIAQSMTLLRKASDDGLPCG